MKITIRYFASIRELIGTGQETLETQAQSLADLRLEISARGDAFAQALGADKVVRMAMNQTVCDEQTKLVEGAEIAFFPPVTGG